MGTMKNPIAAVSAVLLLGASGFVAWTVISGPGADTLRPEQSKPFNFQHGAAPPRTLAATQEPEQWRDAVADDVSPRPIRPKSMRPDPEAKAAPTQSAVLPDPAQRSSKRRGPVHVPLLR